ncbi:hypothetical protein [Nocardioides mangrovi]|uniref:Uncharacterized protein n=1 Tax=Nocardioides mangrovi TaxID=2874580 RepID=A0ABS7UHZ8_9ACTN|nr:hypothetical protein [Nocardioides mangrovi]MBZ5740663.1 hypothetical protein [Nocardioides mangrovi]
MDDSSASASHEAIEEVLVFALQRSTAPKDGTAWWSPKWDPSEDLWGPGSPVLRNGPQRDAVVKATRDAVASLGHQVDDDQAFRLYCGALIEGMKDSADEVDTESPRRPWQAAYVLLGLAPRSYYSALEDPAGKQTWPPLGMSRKDICEDLTAKRAQAKETRGTSSTASGPVNWFGTNFDAKQFNTRRVLVSYLLTRGELTYHSWNTGHRPKVNELARQLHDMAISWLSTPERLQNLTARWPLTAATASTAAQVNPVVPMPHDPTTARELKPGPRTRRRRVLPKVFGPPRVAAATAAVATLAALCTYLTLDQYGSHPSRSADAGVSVTNSPSPDPYDEPTTPLLGVLKARNLSYTSSYDGAGYSDWLNDVVVGNRIELRLKLRNPTETVLTGIQVQLQSDPPDDTDLTSHEAETLEVRVKTNETTGFVIPLDESPATIDEDNVTNYDSASTILSAPDSDYDHCSTSGQFSPDGLTYSSRSSEFPGATFTQETMPVPETSSREENRPVGRYFVGDIDPGETVTLTIKGTFQYPDSDTAAMSGGNAVEIAVNDHEWNKLDSARVGDTVSALVMVHDSSCSTTEFSHVVRLRTSTSRSGVMTVSGTVDQDTDLGSSKINLTGTRRARLVPVAGSTRLYGYVVSHPDTESAKCGKTPVKLQALPDGVLQAGVEVSVVGYVPREPCDSHMKWVMTDFRVVGN